MRSADVLLLLNDGTNIPGKTFEYLAARRPILAVVPESPAADLVLDTAAGVVVSPDDERGIELALKGLYDSWARGELGDLEDRPALRRYSRQQTALELANVFDDVVKC